MKRNELKMKASLYPKIVEWSEEDGCFVGTCPGLMFGGIHGGNETKVYAELCEAVEEVIEILETDGHPLPEALGAKKFSGKFVLRLEPALHRRLAAKAIAAGESLNSYCVKTLVKT
jgi:predicted HicB family RNase H-like nuclease